MAKRKRLSLNPKDYPAPTKWFSGYVSQRQYKHFLKTPKLKKFLGGMAANTPKRGEPLKKRISRLPARVKRRGK